MIWEHSYKYMCAGIPVCTCVHRFSMGVCDWPLPDPLHATVASPINLWLLQLNILYRETKLDLWVHTVPVLHQHLEVQSMSISQLLLNPLMVHILCLFSPPQQWSAALSNSWKETIHKPMHAIFKPCRLLWGHGRLRGRFSALLKYSSIWILRWQASAVFVCTHGYL